MCLEISSCRILQKFLPEIFALLPSVIQAAIPPQILARVHTKVPSGFPPDISRCIPPEICRPFPLRTTSIISTRILWKFVQKRFLGISMKIQLVISQEFFLGIISDAYLCVSPDIQFFSGIRPQISSRILSRKSSKNFYNEFLQEISYKFLNFFLGAPPRINLEIPPGIATRISPVFLRIFPKRFIQKCFLKFLQEFHRIFLHYQKSLLPNVKFY